MPKLWTATIDAHRRAVRDATLDATAALVAAHGLSSVTMSQIAREAGIGRATLYKYFSDVDAIVVAWHERQVERHLEHLTKALGHGGSAGERLKAVLESYALNAHRHQDSELAARLHWGGHVARAHQHLREFIRELLVEGAEAGSVRRDVAPEELAGYCLHALTAAGDLPSEAAVRRLVGVVVDGLRPPG